MSQPSKGPGPIANFLIGGFSGACATTCIQPIDFVKVQIQLQSEGKKGVKINPIAVAKDVIAQKGFAHLYTGLTAAWLRQIFYASTRFGIYHTLQDRYKKKNPGGQPNFFERTFYSLFAGAVGAYVGTPPDLALLRMQADISLPPEKRRNYKNVFDAIGRIIREEGFTNLWRGATPTVFRAMAMNFGMLVNFDVAKDYLVANVGQFNGLRFVASAYAAFWAAFCCLPFDNVKTKLQKMMPDEHGKLPYKGFGDCFVQTAKREGFLGLWVGFNTFFARVAPHAIISLVLIDVFKSLLE